MVVHRDPSPQTGLARRMSFGKWMTQYGAIGFAVLAIIVAALAFQWPTISREFPDGDDSGYLFDGVRLVEQGVWMPLGSGPLAGMANATLYTFFPRDHMLLGEVSTLRRAILLIAILAAAGLAAGAVGGRRAALIGMLLSAIARPVSIVLENSADSLYTALSGLSFAALLWAWSAGAAGNNSRPRWLLVLSGLLMGIGALARLDGLLLGGLLVVSLWLLRGRNRWGARDVVLFAGGLALPLCAYLLAYGMITGKWDPQLGQRSYLAFEQGHNFLYGGRYDVSPTPSSADLYGTAEQNGYSVPRAVLNNPRAFASRVPLAVADGLRMYENAYSIVGGLLFLFLVAAGLVAGGRTRICGAPLLALVWCVPLAGYLLASYRPGFFGTVFPELLTIVILGALPVLAQARALFGSEMRPVLAVWILVAAGALFAQAEFTVQQIRTLAAQQGADSAYRVWLQELEQQVPRGACIVTYDGAAAIYSNHVAFSRWEIFSETRTAEDLRRSMQAGNCHYLIVSEDLRSAAPDFVSLAETTLQPTYTSLPNDETIYLLP